MNNDKIYVDATPPATLYDGVALMNFSTLLDAVRAWRRMPTAQRKRATIKVAGKDGALDTAHEMERLHFRRKPKPSPTEDC